MYGKYGIHNQYSEAEYDMSLVRCVRILTAGRTESNIIVKPEDNTFPSIKETSIKDRKLGFWGYATLFHCEYLICTLAAVTMRSQGISIKTLSGCLLKPFELAKVLR